MSDQYTSPASRCSVPFRPRRPSTTPSQRPRTFSGEIQPQSDFLRNALREKKGLPPRSQSTTPRRARASLGTTQQKGAHDEWMPSSDEECNSLRTSTGRRPQKARRASDIGTMKSSLSPNANLGQRETGNKLDKLEKDNFDLKLKITMQQERMNQLHDELEEAVSSAQDLNTAVELLSRSIASAEEELERTRASNQEITEVNDELLKELEERDEGIKLRQLAIEEAAGIIQTLEIKCEKLEKLEKLEKVALRPDVSPRPGSDYFSGDAEGTPVRKVAPSNPPENSAHLGVLPTPPDSDYFSADTSPNNTPKTPRLTNKAAQMVRAQANGARFNKELGLRSAASKDSLFSSFIDTPSLPPAPERLLRRRTPVPDAQARAKVSLQRAMTTMESSRQDTRSWAPDSRQLRTLFAQGETNRRIHASTPLRHTNTPPSVTIGSAPSSNEEVLSPPVSQPQLSRSPSALSDPTATPSQKPHQARNLAPIQQQQPPIIPARTPVNYNNWPRKYPEWPPSLSLRDRDILFHGDGLGEMFLVPTPEVTSHSRLRSSSVTPTDTLGLPSPTHSASIGAGVTTTPPSDPTALMKKAFSYRLSASLNSGRPREPERRKTTLR
ncbi:hypothetical protein E6O75_ATG08413 [Venturia nashicola]|uniref:Centrosomin N-terminal motif 1 domain-containing protein n=1 Tax=Venturia nashicola TaxID=86259 RepID=A0A4Z1P4L6_9PEZI|nr:hypothetical protein E6O75_ATG08413 [Venturia nashicola]